MFQKINIYAKAFTKCLHAFTLAEVLITLGIIGVIAAMTLPVIMSKVQSVILKISLKQLIQNYLKLFYKLKPEWITGLAASIGW